MTNIRIMTALLMFVIAVTNLGQHAWAQDIGTSNSGDRAALLQQIELFHSEIVQLREEVSKLHRQREVGAVEASAASYANLQSFHEHQIRLRDQAQAKLSWHLQASYAMAVVVVLVVLFGLWLAYVEVRRSLAASAIAPLKKEEDKEGHGGGTQPGAHQLVLSPSSVQITSAITGVVILVISLGFLYLFLQEVYRLEPQDWTTVSTPQGNETD